VVWFDTNSLFASHLNGYAGLESRSVVTLMIRLGMSWKTTAEAAYGRPARNVMGTLADQFQSVVPPVHELYLASNSIGHKACRVLASVLQVKYVVGTASRIIPQRVALTILCGPDGTKTPRPYSVLIQQSDGSRIDKLPSENSLLRPPCSTTLTIKGS
jgi:hypothetical protein